MRTRTFSSNAHAELVRVKRIHPDRRTGGCIDELEKSPRPMNSKSYVYKGLNSSELIKATVSYILKANQFIEKFF
jgi:hypothetical protein